MENYIFHLLFFLEGALKILKIAFERLCLRGSYKLGRVNA